MKRHPLSPRRVIDAAQAFVRIEASSGISLFVAAVVAMLWANSRWGGFYTDLWHTQLSVNAGIFRIDEDLRGWLNDGLMTLFFFLMGLEIKRELARGEMSDARRALLPGVAALGGMAVPALIYIGFNHGTAASSGWGIPMATDIAFALGVLSLLGRRIPFGVKVFLLALAIADDIGAIIVIAVFYTASIDVGALLLAIAILTSVVLLSRFGLRFIGVYAILGVALWVAVFESGVHATLAGVALGLLTPANPQDMPTLSASRAESDAPLDQIERFLLPGVSFLVVPLFALANAGVVVSQDLAREALTSPISQGVVLGLVLGKPFGIVAATWLAVRLRLCALPKGATWWHIAGVGLLGGIGFTVSLLVAGLALNTPEAIVDAKLGVLCASVVAAVIGSAFLLVVSQRAGATAEADG